MVVLAAVLVKILQQLLARVGMQIDKRIHLHQHQIKVILVVELVLMDLHFLVAVEVAPEQQVVLELLQVGV
jgi:hypothetical protein